ncbi:hypothetical protein BAnh1_12630 [Bartonella australis AUST/NH1]|uniref:C-type lysozyme inhibitor domain-containing protein n=1 Tax=Bartonella australis (strain Aust/NH1) TaxID=1094489 RepID=M1P5K5_BARAA|nr:MliC family protein [Bartonella australis]AGF75130.1 hypothetical protein BAnh1_12630 [Bartonella australis AUST/NH1]
MKKNLLILGFLSALSSPIFTPLSAFAEALIIEVPDDPKPTTQIVVYQCDTGNNKEEIEATYFNADNVSLVDFQWNGERIIGSNVIAASGAKYVGAQYIWWETKGTVILYDLINDPKEEKPIRCIEEKRTQ